jgi:dihydroorotase
MNNELSIISHERLLQQVRIIDPSTGVDRLGDVLIIEGKITSIESHIVDYPPHTQIIDGKNLILGTGLVDLYSHSSEPGNEARETLSGLAASAASGGFTQLSILPDTTPSLDNAEILRSIQQKSDVFKSKLTVALPEFHFWGAIAQHGTTQMNELAAMQEIAIGFSGEYNLANLHLFKQALCYLQPLQKPIAIALDCQPLSESGVIREGAASIRYGLPGNPSFSEAATIAAILEIVAEIGTPIHLMRVSTARGVELIADAKQRGIRVTASTTWMHLLFDSDDVASYDPNLRLEPPLGNRHDLEVLIDGVKQGIIDAIAIDHQAYTYEEKTVAFAQAPPGVIGLQLALPLLWQRFVSTGKWSAVELWKALSLAPRKCLQLPVTSIDPQQSHELVLFDSQLNWQVNCQNLETQAQNTPWWNKVISGKAIEVWR